MNTPPKIVNAGTTATNNLLPENREPNMRRRQRFFRLENEQTHDCDVRERIIKTERVSDAVMQSKWERMTPRVRRYLLMAMLRAQRPLRLTAAGFAYMDNGCFLAIMKAAYSYYAVLSQKQV